MLNQLEVEWARGWGLGWRGRECTSSDGPFLSLSMKQVTLKILDGRVPDRKTKTRELLEVTELPLCPCSSMGCGAELTSAAPYPEGESAEGQPVLSSSYPSATSKDRGERWNLGPQKRTVGVILSSPDPYTHSIRESERQTTAYLTLGA